MKLVDLLKTFHLCKVREVPLDKMQMNAAKDRLTERGKQIEEEVDELSKMIKRLKRRDTN